jgi:hypothetical protein
MGFQSYSALTVRSAPSVAVVSVHLALTSSPFRNYVKAKLANRIVDYRKVRRRQRISSTLYRSWHEKVDSLSNNPPRPTETGDPSYSLRVGDVFGTEDKR